MIIEQRCAAFTMILLLGFVRERGCAKVDNYITFPLFRVCEVEGVHLRNNYIAFLRKSSQPKITFSMCVLMKRGCAISTVFFFFLVCERGCAP